MKVLRSIKIEVPSQLAALDRVLVEFERIYQNFIPLQDWLQCRIALAEGFTNAVRHAHQDLPPDVPIGIEIILTMSTIRIQIWDYGSDFDLQGFITETSRQHEGWLASGRGIPILKKIADRLEYYRTEQQQNCLLIVKKFSSYSNPTAIESRS